MYLNFQFYFNVDNYHDTFYFRCQSEESVDEPKNEFLSTQESSIRFVDELVQQAEEALKKIREENKKYISYQTKRQSSSEDAEDKVADDIEVISNDSQEGKDLQTVYYRNENSEEAQENMSLSSSSSTRGSEEDSRELPTISEITEADSDYQEIEEDLKQNSPASEIDNESGYDYLALTEQLPLTNLPQTSTAENDLNDINVENNQDVTQINAQEDDFDEEKSPFRGIDEEVGGIGDNQTTEEENKVLNEVKKKTCSCGPVKNKENNVLNEVKKKTCTCGLIKNKEKVLDQICSIQNKEENHVLNEAKKKTCSCGTKENKEELLQHINNVQNTEVIVCNKIEIPKKAEHFNAEINERQTLTNEKLEDKNDTESITCLCEPIKNNKNIFPDRLIKQCVCNTTNSAQKVLSVAHKDHSTKSNNLAIQKIPAVDIRNGLVIQKLTNIEIKPEPIQRKSLNRENIHYEEVQHSTSEKSIETNLPKSCKSTNICTTSSFVQCDDKTIQTEPFQSRNNSIEAQTESVPKLMIERSIPAFQPDLKKYQRRSVAQTELQKLLTSYEEHTNEDKRNICQSYQLYGQESHIPRELSYDVISAIEPNVYKTFINPKGLKVESVSTSAVDEGDMLYAREDSADVSVFQYVPTVSIQLSAELEDLKRNKNTELPIIVSEEVEKPIESVNLEDEVLTVLDAVIECTAKSDVDSFTSAVKIPPSFYTDEEIQCDLNDMTLQDPFRNLWEGEESQQPKSSNVHKQSQLGVIQGEDKTNSLEKSKDAIVTLGSTMVYDISTSEMSADLPIKPINKTPEPPPRKPLLNRKPLSKNTSTQYSDVILRVHQTQQTDSRPEEASVVSVDLKEVVTAKVPSVERKPSPEKKVGCIARMFKKKNPSAIESEEYIVTDQGTQMSQSSFESLTDDFDDMSSSVHSDSNNEERVRIIIT